MPAGGALGYLTVEGPRPLSYGPPAVDSSWLANLPQQFQQGQQYARERQLQTMFQGPEGAALLANSGIDPNSLFGALAQRGGASAVQGVVPALLGAQQLRGWNQQFGDGQGPQPQQQSYSEPASTGNARDPRGKIPVIIAAAQKYGVDPRTAIRVAQSEGLTSFYGDNGRSGTAFQLYTKGGLGNEFQKETGLNPLDPKNEDAAIDWAMKNVSRTGWSPYKGAAKVGIGPRQGIGVRTAAISTPGSDQLNPADRAAVDQIYSASALAAPPSAATPTPSQEVASRFPEDEGEGEGGPATGAPAPVEQPAGAIGTAPFMASSSPNASGPANIKGPQPVRTASLGPTALPAGQQSPPPSSPGTPAGRDVVTQAPTAGTRVAQATPQGGLGILQPGDSVNALRQSETKIANMRRARPNMYFATEAQQKAMDEQIATEQKNHDQMLERVNKENELRAGIGAEAQKGVQAGDIKRGEATFNGLSSAARQYQSDLKPYLDLTRSIINSPGVYTGAGAQRSLDINRVRAAFGDQKAAMLQEALGKVRAQTVLNTINTQKDEMLEAGGNSGRLFSTQVAQIEKAVPGLETSLAGNRALVEIAGRVGEHQTRVAQMARDYITSQRQRGLPGYLDQGFDDMLSRDLKLHPLFNAKELEHPELIGAPSVPPGLKSKVDIQMWGHSLGLEPGEAIRTPGGDIKALP